MKLAVITDEISQEFEHALDVMQEYHVRAAELRGLWGTNIADLSPEQVARAKAALHDRGMIVPCLSTPLFKCDLAGDAAERGPLHLAKERPHSEQNELLRHLAGLAHTFGTDKIRVFSFWRRGDLTPDLEEQVTAAFTEPIRIAEEEGVTLVLENEHACYLGTGAEAARVAAAHNSPRLRVCWDPGNAFFAGETPFPDGYAAVKPYLGHVHIKDAVRETAADGTPKPRWVVVGEGEIDYPGQFDALRQNGYDGYLSLETHYKPASGSLEEGSRACLTALRRFIHE